MSIWSTLFALRDDDGLEATLIRPVFTGMSDITPAPGYDYFNVRKPGGYEPFKVRTETGWQSFEVAHV